MAGMRPNLCWYADTQDAGVGQLFGERSDPTRRSASAIWDASRLGEADMVKQICERTRFQD